MTGSVLPGDIEVYRDRWWRREPEQRIEDVYAAEQFIEAVGFCAGLTDARRAGPSLFIAVCGRRDAYLPRNVQKDPESSLTWVLKDEIMRRGNVYYGKLAKNRTMFIARRLIPSFHALWGMPRKNESDLLSPGARAVLKVLRKEWEMASRDLQHASGIKDRSQFVRVMDELQRSLKIIPSEGVYEPSFTYIWTVPEARFPEELTKHVTRE